MKSTKKKPTIKYCYYISPNDGKKVYLAYTKDAAPYYYYHSSKKWTSGMYGITYPTWGEIKYEDPRGFKRVSRLEILVACGGEPNVK